MERIPGQTEPMGSATIAAEIHGDEPVLRPRRTIRCRAAVWPHDADANVQPHYSVTFFEGAVWDVARISSRLEVRRADDRARRFRTDQRFTFNYGMLVFSREMERDEAPVTTFFLSTDPHGSVRTRPISIAVL